MRVGIGLGLLAGLVALHAPDARAHADYYPPIAIHSGTICKNYNAREVQDIDYLTTGTRNLSPYARYVICPLVRPMFNPTNVPAGRSVKIYGWHYGYQFTSCTVYVHNSYGFTYGSRTVSTSASDIWFLEARFTEAETPMMAKMSVLCTIPGNAAGIISEIEVDPN